MVDLISTYPGTHGEALAESLSLGQGSLRGGAEWTGGLWEVPETLQQALGLGVEFGRKCAVPYAGCLRASSPICLLHSLYLCTHQALDIY